ncbi:anti-sigma factor RsbA family regulatory protein [Micromonospora sp. NPDC000089]|uniref:anti-sigma factor RsbA family regulatory protein n=1 Tax=unclassified Micromonospora TaxID=2617518 RepID=UPI0036A89083
MRTGAAAGHRGHFHEAVLYGDDEELLAVALPFLLDGVAAGEPTVVSLGGRTEALVRAALPTDAGVTFLSGGEVYARPTAAIRSHRDLLTGHARAGAPQVRIIGELPATAFGPTWDWWGRYESAVNHTFDEFPLWGLCPYDTRVTPAAVLADVARTHPRTATVDGRHLRNREYLEPAEYLRQNRPMVLDPVQRAAPLVELVDPTPALARQAAHAASRDRLSRDDADDLAVAVSETVTNGRRHGLPPVLFRLWTAADRVVVTVTDQGTGPDDPFAGLLPARGASAGGLGLWITHQSCNHVAMQRTAEGFTVRLTAGNPHFVD